MNEEFVLDAELRSDKGKGASRRLRRADKVPAIIYGAGAEPQSIALDHNEVLHRLEYEAFYSHVLTLKVDGKPQDAVLRDVQRHSTKRVILHMDFQRISQDREIHVRVPLHFLNEEKCVGVKQGGGIISRAITEVEVNCLPKNLPEYIEVDLLDLELGESIQLSELKLPPGLELTALMQGEEHDTAVVTIHKPRSAAAVEEAETVEAPAEDEGSTPAGDESGES